MACIIAVEGAIKSRKAEQAKLNDSIQLYKEILHSITFQPRIPIELESADDPPADTSPVEKEELDLLEQALQKALRVRTGLEPSTTKANTVKQSGDQCVTATKKSFRASKGHTKNKLTCESIGRKQQRKHGTSIHPSGTKLADTYKHGETNVPKKTSLSNKCVSTNGTVTSKTLQTFPGHDTPDQHTSHSGPRKQIVRSSQESGADCLLQQNRILEGVSKWTHLKSKEYRLWDKVMAVEMTSLSGRDQFMDRMRATFPMKWPCGSPEKTQALVHRLTHQEQNFTDNRQTKGLVDNQTSKEGTALGGVENINDSLKCKMPQMTAKDIHKLADQAKQEWKSWDRWRPEWGCLCPTGANAEWQKGISASLPMTVTYTTETELTELEKLRMRVRLLQEELFLEETLLDTLSPYLTSVVHGRLYPSLLRDLYSVLGEGGERFPAIVLDSEHDS